MPVNTPCKRYTELALYRDPIDALSGGTPRMREKGEIYLPPDPHEVEDRSIYRRRLARTTLFDAFGRTVQKLVDFPFAKPVAFTEETPEEFAERMQRDIDRSGSSITEFSRVLIDDCVRWGVAFFLCDLPTISEEQRAELTLADDEALGLGKAYFSRIHPLNVIGWRVETVAGITRLKEVRIKDVIEKENPEDPWCPKEVNIVKVYKPGLLEIHEEVKENTFHLTEEIPTELDEIPLVAAYANKIEPLVSLPPLSSLAELNVSHWQNSSDQENFLHAARATILFGAGFEAGDLESIAWGPGITLTNSNEDASMKWVETEGRALAAGDVHLSKIEDRMEAAGLELLIKRRQLETATKTSQRASEAACLLQQIVVSVEEALEKGFKFAAEFENNPAIAESAVVIHKDFGLTDREGHDIKALLEARLAREISRKTYLTELKRRTLFDDLDVDEEILLLEAEEKKAREQFQESLEGPLGKGAEDDDEDEEADNEAA